MKQVNGKALKAWLESQGEDAKVKLHLQSKVSLAWIDKVISGRYDCAPKKITRDALLSATGLAEQDLFPEAATKGKRRSAS